MLFAVVGTLLRFEVVNYQWIIVAFLARIRHRRASRVSDADDGCAAAHRYFPRFRRARFRADRDRGIFTVTSRTASPMGA